LDAGAQPVSGGQPTVCGRGEDCTVRSKRGALGNRAILRSAPQHRMLIQGTPDRLHSGGEPSFWCGTPLVNHTTILRSAM